MAGTPHETPAEIFEKLLAPKPDGSPITRTEMEQRLNDEAKTRHDKRLQAIHLGLDTKVALDMNPVTVKHWVLDQMITKGLIQGEKIGISSDLGADHVPETFQQFCQRLALFIEKGWALQPLPGEVPMSNHLVPPPPMPGQPVTPTPGDGQPATPAFTPPPPPMGMAAPPIPGMIPGAAASAPMVPTMPPAVPTAAPQPSLPGMPAAVPMTMPPIPGQPPVPSPMVSASVPAPGQPPQVPQQAPAAAPAATSAPRLGVLIKAETIRPWGKPSPSRPDARRRTKIEILEDKAWIASGKPETVTTMTIEQAQASGYAVDPNTMTITGAQGQPQAPAAPTAAPTPPAPPQMPQAPQAPTAPSMPMAAPAAPTPAPQAVSNNSIVLRNQEALAKQLDAIKRQVAIVDIAVSALLRQTFQKPGNFNCEEALRELGVNIPS